MNLFIIHQNKHIQDVMPMVKRDYLIAAILMVIGIVIMITSFPVSVYIILTSTLPVDAFSTLVAVITIVGVLFLIGGIYLIGQIYSIWSKVEVRIRRPVTAVVLGICFGIAFWSIPFFVVANYVLLPEYLMNLFLGLILFFMAWGSVLSVGFFILGFILGLLLIFTTSSSASF